MNPEIREYTKCNLTLSDGEEVTNGIYFVSALIRIADAIESIDKNIIKLIETQKCKEKK